jgi:hypothetical protein
MAQGIGRSEGYDPPHGRWLYIDESRAEEHSFREEALQRIDAFWSALARRSDDLKALFSKRQRWDLPAFMAEHLLERAILLVAKTPNLELWRAAHGPAPFYDERFTRGGETFAYVKLDGSAGLDEEKFADKAEIEDALDELLLPAGLGCQIGGGTGLRYSYIDLALTDRRRALPAICERLRAGNVPRRSWIQFFARNLQSEWIGIYADSPPPPMGG